MKSRKYLKTRVSKYSHKTHIVSGSGNVKGELVIGTKSALQEAETFRGRKLDVHHIEKNKGQWIFCELKK